MEEKKEEEGEGERVWCVCVTRVYARVYTLRTTHLGFYTAHAMHTHRMRHGIRIYIAYASIHISCVRLREWRIAYADGVCLPPPPPPSVTTPPHPSQHIIDQPHRI